MALPAQPSTTVLTCFNPPTQVCSLLLASLGVLQDSSHKPLGALCRMAGCGLHGLSGGVPCAVRNVGYLGYVAVLETHTFFVILRAWHRCCLKTGILMLLSHWGYGLFGVSPIFTHSLLISTRSTPFQVDFSPPWGPPLGLGLVWAGVSPTLLQVQAWAGDGRAVQSWATPGRCCRVSTCSTVWLGRGRRQTRQAGR